ncbi:hypothetical protein [Hyphomonas atlantica]|nr:hypothetical protein [Hyphomonas atlantica]
MKADFLNLVFTVFFGPLSCILVTALVLDAVALGAFLILKWQADPTIILIAIGGMTTVFAFERFFLRHLRNQSSDQSTFHDHMDPS